MDFPGGDCFLPELRNARDITKAIIAVIVRGLRAGKSPKEIAMMSGETHANIQIIIHRYRDVHDVFIKTYRLRNPHKETLPPKMAHSLREV